jgi:hypothetical protein
MLVGMGRGVQILGCSDHAGESVSTDPMRTGSSRVAHGTTQMKFWRFRSTPCGDGSVDRRNLIIVLQTPGIYCLLGPSKAAFWVKVGVRYRGIALKVHISFN